jgi:2-iminoacetate synthase
MKDSFFEVLNLYDWNELEKRIQNISNSEVERVISLASHNAQLDNDAMMALVSPAASNYLEQFAQISRKKTQRRFGKTIQLYIPLYLSNYCTNNCVYCGFNAHNNIKRIILNDEEILAECAAIKAMGYEHILLVTGESTHKADVGYLSNVIKLIKPLFHSISLEVQPLETYEYKKLIDAGVNSVYIYQETYNKLAYPQYHPNGKKSDFRYRLATPERLGEAGMYRIGLGALLGLENWRVEAFCIALHLRFLQKKYWRTKYSISFPRMRPYVGSFQPKHIVSDAELAQMIWAFRLFDEDVEMSLTTREDKEFRNNMLTLGITSMSAGSKTDPGGYATHINELEQFAVNDDRSAAELSEYITNKGYSAVWKDWDVFL